MAQKLGLASVAITRHAGNNFSKDSAQPLVKQFRKSMAAEDDEREWIRQSREGRAEAFAALVRQHQRMIHSLTYRMTGSLADAEDLAQEAFVRAWQHLDSFQGDGNVRAVTFGDWLRPNTSDAGSMRVHQFDVNKLSLDGEKVWVGGRGFIALVDLKSRQIERLCDFDLSRSKDVHGLQFDGKHLWVTIENKLYRLSKTDLH